MGGSLRMGTFFSEDLFQKSFFILWFKWFIFLIGMEAWVGGIIIHSLFSDIFCCWGENVGLGAFFWSIYFQIFFILWLKWFNFSHWHGSMGKGSDYLFYCLFSDNMFLLRLEHGDGSIGTGAWGWEQFFLMTYFQKKVFIWFKGFNFLHWHWSVVRGNDYLFCDLFSDYIFLGGGSMGTGA